MSWLLKFMDGPLEGEYLVSYDPDYHDGAGKITGTTDPEEARKFDSSIDALEEWKRQSTVQPLRMDGKPNRPMSAWTVQVKKHE